MGDTKMTRITPMGEAGFSRRGHTPAMYIIVVAAIACLLGVGLGFQLEAVKRLWKKTGERGRGRCEEAGAGK